LAALAVELEETTALVDSGGQTYRAAEKALQAVEHLRYLLAVFEARWEIAEPRHYASRPWP